MLAILDVHYSKATARAACVMAADWTAAQPTVTATIDVQGFGDYEPGNFYRRELGPLLGVLGKLPRQPTAVVIDGYVWLDAAGRPGLGAHLQRALTCLVPVIGVAKTAYRGAPAVEVLRGGSKRPLFVSSAGVPVEDAAARVATMHGPFRIPTLLKEADRLARTDLEPRGGPSHR